MGRYFGTAGEAVADRSLTVAAAPDNARVVEAERRAAQERAAAPADPTVTTFAGAVAVEAVAAEALAEAIANL